MRALIVDDSRFVRGYVRGLLEEKGIACEEAGDGQAALDLVLGGKPFDLALVDWNMPVMNGLDFIEALRAQPAYDHVRILMVTSETESDQVTRAINAGANEYLMKPFSPEVLIAKLDLLDIFED